VFWLVLFAWGGLGASFGPILLLSLFWKKITKAGVIAGFVWGHLVPPFFISLFLTICVSFWTSTVVQRKSEFESIRAKYK